MAQSACALCALKRDVRMDGDAGGSVGVLAVVFARLRDRGLVSSDSEITMLGRAVLTKRSRRRSVRNYVYEIRGPL